MLIPTHVLSETLKVLAYVIPVIGVIVGILLIKNNKLKKAGVIVLSLSVIICIAFVCFVILGID